MDQLPATPVDITVTDAEQALLHAIERDILDAHSRHSRFQIEHFMATQREYPGNADKYHQRGLELLVRYAGVSNQVYNAQRLSAELAMLLAQEARWRWARWLPAVRRRLDLMNAEIQFRRRQLAFVAQDLREYFRELLILQELRARHRADALEAGECLEWDASQEARWVERIKAEPELQRYVDTHVRTGFSRELGVAALPDGGAT